MGIQYSTRTLLSDSRTFKERQDPFEASHQGCGTGSRLRVRIRVANKRKRRTRKPKKKKKKEEEELKNRRDGHKERKDGASKWYMGEEIMMEGGKRRYKRKRV